MTTPRYPGRGGARGGRPRRHRNERGSAGIDFLLVAPVLVLIVFALLMQWGIKMRAASEVDAAAREGAVAAARFDGTSQDGSATATAFLDDIGADVTHVQVTANRGPRTAVVEVHAEVRQLVPLFDLKVSATAEQPVEVFVP